jgi:cell wall-associated NlpC family hydrolase
MPQHPGRQREALVLFFAVRGARRLALVVVAFAFAATLVPAAAPAPVQASGTQADKVIYFAKNQLGKPWKYAAIGLSRYDCSGLVYRTFYEKGLLNKIGGSRRTAKGYYTWFKERGLASRYNPRRGDLVVWGYGSHIGIYIGDGKAISTLSTGVKIHGVYAVTANFTAYLHVNLTR